MIMVFYHLYLYYAQFSDKSKALFIIICIFFYVERDSVSSHEDDAMFAPVICRALRHQRRKGCSPLCWIRG